MTPAGFLSGDVAIGAALGNMAIQPSRQKELSDSEPVDRALVCDIQTGAILFIGRVMDPST